MLDNYSRQLHVSTALTHSPSYPLSQVLMLCLTQCDNHDVLVEVREEIVTEEKGRYKRKYSRKEDK
jgi:hypothetical protein